MEHIAVVVPIIVALIAGPVMWMLKRFDNRNSHQHQQNMQVLERVESKVDKVVERMDDHIDWHLGKGIRHDRSA